VYFQSVDSREVVGHQKRICMTRCILVSCNSKHYPRVNWFGRLLSTRLKVDVPFNIKIIYRPWEKDHSSGEGINLIIPIRPATQEEISKVFDKVSTNSWIKRSGHNFILDIDLVRFAIWILGREEEFMQKKDTHTWDKHGRFRLEKTLAYKRGLWQKPVLDILLIQLIERIEDEIGIDILNRNPWGNKKSKAVWLTHDVDKLIGRYVLPLRILGWIGLAFRELAHGNKKGFLKWVAKCKHWLSTEGDPTYGSIKKILDEEEQVNAKSTFYFMGLKYGVSLQESIRYPINHRMTIKIIQELKRNGCSVGLHPAYHKPYDEEYLNSQKMNLEKVLGDKVHLARNHYLRVRYPDSWDIEEKSGFYLISNVGWASHNGFRAGTCWPYHPFDFLNNRSFSIIEVPFMYMDSGSSGTQGIVDQVSDLAKKVASVHGLLTINFHSTLWDEFEFPYRGQGYKGILVNLYRDDWHFAEPKEIINIFIDNKIIPVKALN